MRQSVLGVDSINPSQLLMIRLVCLVCIDPKIIEIDSISQMATYAE